MRFILASKSPSRLELLRRAGLDPEVHASDVDESLITDPQPVRLALRRAAAKGEFAAERVAGEAILKSPRRHSSPSGKSRMAATG